MSDVITNPDPGARNPVPGSPEPVLSKCQPEGGTRRTDLSNAQPAPTPRRCRSLTVRGLQCRERALRGHDLCVTHAKNRFPVCPKGPRGAIPLLEDLDTIQVVATQVAQGLFAETLDPHRAGKILYACQVAALTLPRPARLKPADKLPDAQHPAADVFPALDGSLLGPSLSWSADQVGFEPVWSFHKHLYERECERQGKPKPAGPDEFPANGWLTPDEVQTWNRRPEELWETFGEQLLRLRIEADQRGELPPLIERTRCLYAKERICDGPASDHPCEFCYREREEFLRLPSREEPSLPRDSAPDSVGDLQAVAQPAPEPSQPSLDELLDPLGCANLPPLAFVSGHDLAACGETRLFERVWLHPDRNGCGINSASQLAEKLARFEGAQLQLCHKSCKTSPALAAEGWLFFLLGLFPQAAWSCRKSFQKGSGPKPLFADRPSRPAGTRSHCRTRQHRNTPSFQQLATPTRQGGGSGTSANRFSADRTSADRFIADR
jgi:hypothetical protein